MSEITLDNLSLGKGNVLLAKQENSLWSGDMRVNLKPPALTDPSINWKGGKMGVAMFRQALSFCHASFKRTGKEALMRVMYNQDTEQFGLVVPPQELSSGLYVKEIPDHARRDEAFALFPDYDTCGTIHHHCGISAFQSGTDEADEVGQNQVGMHITFGKLQDKFADFHMRVVFGGFNYETAGANFDYTDWFEVTDYNILKLERMPEYPAVWDEMLIEAPKKVYSVPARPTWSAWKNNSRPSKTSGSTYSMPARGVSTKDPRPVPDAEVSGNTLLSPWYSECEMGVIPTAEVDCRDHDEGIVWLDPFIESMHIQPYEEGFDEYYKHLRNALISVEGAAKRANVPYLQFVNDLQLFGNTYYGEVMYYNWADKFNKMIDYEETPEGVFIDLPVEEPEEEDLIRQAIDEDNNRSYYEQAMYGFM